MATVVGMTAQRIMQLVNSLVKSGSINENTGVLTLQTYGGQNINAGSIGSPTDIISKAYPIGSIFMSTVSTNPESLLGFGVWSAWGTGRVPVGVDTSQTEFDAPNKLGGAKTHTLTTAEMPSHNHGSSGSHNHELARSAATGGANATIPQGTTSTASTTALGVSSNGAHTHSSEGGGEPHNNLQPFITCYMWRRVS